MRRSFAEAAADTRGNSSYTLPGVHDGGKLP